MKSTSAWCVLFSLALAPSCGPSGSGFESDIAQESEGAQAIVDLLRAKFKVEVFQAAAPDRIGKKLVPALSESRVKWFAQDASSFLAQFSESDSANLVISSSRTSSGTFTIRHPGGGMTLSVALRGSVKVDGQVGRGYLVYPGGLPATATVLERIAPDSVEDYFDFELRPSEARIAYDVNLENVSAIRLFRNTAEFIDKSGIPRIRIASPYLVDSAGIRHAASIAIEGCEYDSEPAPPWNRELVAPGSKSCAVVVTWNSASIAYPALLDPEWQATQRMVVNRVGHVSSGLSNDTVLVAGGYGYLAGNNNTFPFGYLTDAEIYNPKLNSWTAVGPMHVNRISFSATTLLDGRVLVTGGLHQPIEPNLVALASAETFDQNNGQWTLTPPMHSARTGHTTTLLPDGRVLAAGGETEVLFGEPPTSDIFDPLANNGAGSWLPVQNMLVRRVDHSAVLLKNDTVMATGGWRYSRCWAQDCFYDSTETFDPAANNGQGAWMTGQPLRQPRTLHSAVALNGGAEILVVGGRNLTACLRSSELGIFNSAFSFQGDLPAAEGREYHTATLLKNGQVVVAGGDDCVAGVSAATFRWLGPNLGFPWVVGPTMISPRAGHTANALKDGRILVAGGAGPFATADAETIDPTQGLPCKMDSECASGFCVNAVCCNAKCDDPCSACSVAQGASQNGQCTARPDGRTCFPSGGIGVCGTGVCALVECEPGFSDCNQKVADGCEVSVQSDSMNCGRCGNVCPNTAVCQKGSCTCGSGKVLCNQDACVNLLTDPSNCGGCDVTCSPNNVVLLSCGNGTCDGNCSVGFADCENTLRINGCQTSLSTDVDHCGGCGMACSGKNILRTCIAGSCQSGSCQTGFGDCNNDKRTDGCEANLLTDPKNCGLCGATCNQQSVCRNGACKLLAGQPCLNGGVCASGVCTSLVCQ